MESSKCFSYALWFCWLFITDGFGECFVQLLSAVNCWFKCMVLDPYNQTDHPECKSRPDSGLSAITELDPGYITGRFTFFYRPLKFLRIQTRFIVIILLSKLALGWSSGPLSTVWKEWLKWCVEFGIEANAIVAVPYDWRLSPTKLEERDLYFHKLKLVLTMLMCFFPSYLFLYCKISLQLCSSFFLFCRLTFETALKLRGGPSIVFAHSMGNNVFRYFLEWLRLEIAPKHYLEWLDQHIHAYFAVGTGHLFC